MRDVLVEAAPEETTSSRASAFWWRLTDNLFRRLIWFLLPIVALTAIGVMQAGKELELYRSSATLSATSNPFLPEQQIAGTAAQFFESPAAAMSRVANEQLRTDSFLRRVSDQAGLGSQIESGAISLEIVRSSVWTGSAGDSIMRVSAQWADPVTSQQLVTATIGEFRSYLNETLAADARDAEQFFSTQLEQYTADHEAAIEALDDFVAGLPDIAPGEEYPLTVQLQLDRLSEEVSAASSKIRDVEDAIEGARLTQTQQASETSRLLEVIDPAQAPSAPESTLVAQVITVVTYMVLGAVIALAALAATTLVGQNVVSAADLVGLPGVSVVATVPEIGSTRWWRRRRSTSPGLTAS